MSRLERLVVPSVKASALLLSVYSFWHGVELQKEAATLAERAMAEAQVARDAGHNTFFEIAGIAGTYLDPEIGRPLVNQVNTPETRAAVKEASKCIAKIKESDTTPECLLTVGNRLLGGFNTSMESADLALSEAKRSGELGKEGNMEMNLAYAEGVISVAPVDKILSRTVRGVKNLFRGKDRGDHSALCLSRITHRITQQ